MEGWGECVVGWGVNVGCGWVIVGVRLLSCVCEVCVCLLSCGCVV